MVLACSKSTMRSRSHSLESRGMPVARQPFISAAPTRRSPRSEDAHASEGADHRSRRSCLSPSKACSTRSRAPTGQHTGWAYCHVPNGSDVDMTDRIEQQIERFAPGFRDVVLARHVMSASRARSAQCEHDRRRHVRRIEHAGPAAVATDRAMESVHHTKPALVSLLGIDPAGRRRAWHVRLLGREKCVEAHVSASRAARIGSGLRNRTVAQCCGPAVLQCCSPSFSAAVLQSVP